MTQWYDTVVAGAGPAGAMAARAAAASGTVLLVESVPLPRDKSCGGMLNRYSQRFLSQFATIPDGLVLPPARVNFRYVDWDRGIRKPTSLEFLNVDRARFDDWLLSLLPDNVEVRDACAVEDFSEEDDSVLVTLAGRQGPAQVRCATLVGADGARSKVRRLLGAGSAANYVTLQDFVELKGEIEPYFDCIYMRGIGDAYAYSYLVPKNGTAIIGSVCYPRTKHPKDGHEHAVETLRAAFPALGKTVKREASAALYVRSADDVVPGKGRVLLAGEAGGFMSPTSGEGISYALFTGAFAGRAIAEEGPAGALARYLAETASMRGDIVRRLKWLPVMESSLGKYLAGFVPTSVVSRVTEGL